MSQTVNTRKRIIQGHKKTSPLATIMCMQINVQHSRTATDNLMNLIEQDSSDIIFMQEPYLYNNRMTGLRNSSRNYTSPAGTSRAAILITNNKIDAILIKQLSNSDCVLIELKYNNTKFYAASMYFDITEKIERELDKMEEILDFTKGNGLLIAVDRNSRSTTWHDSQTNKRGEILEEYVISRNLHIMNEESDQTTFQSRRGSSNIDVTIVNNQLLNALQNWKISEEESCSDHNIIKFDLRQDTYHDTEYSYTGYRYVVTDGSLKTFDSNLSRLVATKFHTGQGDPLNLDRALALQVKEANDIERAVKLFHEALILSCNRSFNKRNATKPMDHKTVPWWTKELTIMRKRTNALRRRYQRTTNNNDLRERRKKTKRHNTKQQLREKNSNLGKNFATSPRQRTHGTSSTNLPRTKRREAKHCRLY